jgi:hypothetical protein
LGLFGQGCEGGRTDEDQSGNGRGRNYRGKAYPLNGQAERRPDLYGKGPLNKLSDIWMVDPEISKLAPDARMSLDAFTREAIEACAKAGKWAIQSPAALKERPTPDRGHR